MLNERKMPFSRKCNYVTVESRWVEPMFFLWWWWHHSFGAKLYVTWVWEVCTCYLFLLALHWLGITFMGMSPSVPVHSGMLFWWPRFFVTKGAQSSVEPRLNPVWTPVRRKPYGASQPLYKDGAYALTYFVTLNREGYSFSHKVTQCS